MAPGILNRNEDRPDKRWWLLRVLGSSTEDGLSVQVVGETHTSELGHDPRHLINDLFLLSGGKPEPFQVR